MQGWISIGPLSPSIWKRTRHWGLGLRKAREQKERPSLQNGEMNGVQEKRSEKSVGKVEKESGSSAACKTPGSAGTHASFHAVWIPVVAE